MSNILDLQTGNDLLYKMEILQTPEERFAGLPDYPFKPNYIQLDDVRMHYVDEIPSGNRRPGVVLLLHGEPSWSYLYRKMIPVYVQAGYRTVAPDLIGFGKSDKPAGQNDYSYQSHMDWLTAFLKKTGLTGIHLFCQDWGGMLGLRLAAENPECFASITAANTFLQTGDTKMPEAFLEWQNFSQKVKRLPVGRIIKNGCSLPLTPEVIKAYEAPFPDETYKAGARIFPSLVPVSPDDPASDSNRRAWKVLEAWQKPFLCLFSDGDPITKGADIIFRRKVPGAKGQPHETIQDGGHFLQEDQGPVIAAKMVKWLNAIE